LNEVAINSPVADSKEEFIQGMKNFFNKSAKVWQSYISYEFINGIELSEAQKRIVNTESQQLMINGSAGSGKSIVLLYKLIKLMMEEKEPKRFLYISYNQTLIEDTLKRSKMYKGFNELTKKHETVDICTFHQFTGELLNDLGFSDAKNININYSNMERIRNNSIVKIAPIHYRFQQGGPCYNELEEDERLYKSHDREFIRDEFLWMKANGYITLEGYIDCERTGRGNTPRLIKNQRKTIFKMFQEYEDLKRNRKWTQTMVDLEDYALEILKRFEQIPESSKYDYIFVDEVQDLDAMQLLVLARLSPKSLIIAGDPKQKIYKRAPHNYSGLGIDIKNSNKTLYENFRSTEEIMNLANSLNFNDIVKDNSKIKYKNNGGKPRIVFFNDWNKAIKNLGETILDIQKREPNASVAIITREEDAKALGNSSDLKKLISKYFRLITIEQYGKAFKFENEKQVIYTDLFNVKGLEFDYVFILQFDINHYPNHKEVEKYEQYSGKKAAAKDKNTEQYKDYDDLVNTEKKRLYVAMSRAKKHLELYCVTKTEGGISYFIDDFDKEDYEYKANPKAAK
jgi:DNA helicase II / ATP-dependent DNA helicase PcrA